MGRYALIKSNPYDNRNFLFQSRVLTLKLIGYNQPELSSFVHPWTNYGPRDLICQDESQGCCDWSGLNHMSTSGTMEMMDTTLVRLWKGQYKGNQDTKDEWTEVRQGTTENMQARVLSKVNTVETQTLLMTYFQVKHCCPS